jgi:hypothetical protein
LSGASAKPTVSARRGCQKNERSRFGRGWPRCTADLPQGSVKRTFRVVDEGSLSALRRHSRAGSHWTAVDPKRKFPDLAGRSALHARAVISDSSSDG